MEWVRILIVSGSKKGKENQAGYPFHVLVANLKGKKQQSFSKGRTLTEWL
jgi:hypothetical protein